MRTVSPARLGAFWFGIQAIWGALLGISLQARTIALHPHDATVAYGWLASAGALAAALTQLAVGPPSDRLRREGYPRTPFFVVGAIGGCACIVWFYLAPSFAALLVATIALQICMNVAIGPYQAVIPDYVAPERAGVPSAWMGGLQSLGNAAGALIATFAGAPVAIALALCAGLVVSGMLTVSHVRDLPLRRLPTQAKGALGRPAVDLFISRALLYVGFYTLLGYMFFYVRDVVRASNITQTTGIVILIFTIAGALGAAAVARPADRIDRRAIVNAATAVVAAAIVLFLQLHDPLAVYAIAFVAGAGWGAFLAADWAIGCAVLPASLMSTAMAVWNLAVAGPQIIAPALTTLTIVGLHVAQQGAPSLAFTLAALELVAGALWIWRIPAL